MVDGGNVLIKTSEISSHVALDSHRFFKFAFWQFLLHCRVGYSEFVADGKQIYMLILGSDL